MNPSQTLLVIADIGGYTRFMREQRTALAHAQVVVAMLLEAVIDGSDGLELEKLEGDAALFRARGGAETSAPLLPRIVASAHARFIARKRELIAHRTCSCGACSNLEALGLKFVAHSGEVVRQKVKRHVELAGLDVILVHRMLKNGVPMADYLLVTDPVLERLDPPARAQAIRLDHDFEGIGPTPTHYLPIPAASEPVPRASLASRILGRAMLEIMALPARMGRQGR